QVLNSSPVFIQNLQETLEKIREIFKTDYCKIFLKEGDELSLKSRVGKEHLEEFELAENKCISEVSDSEQVKLEEVQDSNGASHTLIVLPLKKDKKISGMLSLVVPQPQDEIETASVNILETIASQLGEAYEISLLNIEVIEKKKIENELEIARSIQQSLIPDEFPVNDYFEIGALNRPALTIGGDYYEYLNVDADHSGFIMADVSGKGISAGLFMAITRSLFLSKAAETIDVLKTMEGANNLICKDAKKGMFVTLFYALCNTETRELCYSSAGHNEQFMYRVETGEVELLHSTGIPMGIFNEREFTNYSSRTVKYNKGDILFLFTDGVSEASNSNNEMYGD
ncbi:MAG: SpoIIE family protein phosphatase, partial [Actinomycetia bacterium]|nr:SpoIIE family protein phosphatase [Actinomycetes bacterium]